MMTVIGKPLIKFIKEEYLEDFLSGKLYMNSLQWYREHESKEEDGVVGDAYEALLQLVDAYISIPEEEYMEHVKCGLIKTSYSDDFSLCMFGKRTYEEDFVFTDVQKELLGTFGEKAVIITNRQEFLKRVYMAAKSLGVELYAGNINYLKEDGGIELLLSLIQGTHNIAFWKRDKYSYQEEFRLLIHDTKCEDDHFVLDVGDLRDITKVYDIDAVLNCKIQSK